MIRTENSFKKVQKIDINKNKKGTNFLFHLAYLFFSILKEYFSTVTKANSNTIFSHSLEGGKFFFIFFDSELESYNSWVDWTKAFSFCFFLVATLSEISKKISSYYLKVSKIEETSNSNKKYENKFIPLLINFSEICLKTWLFTFLIRKITPDKFKEYLHCAILNTIIYLIYKLFTSKKRLFDKLKDKGILLHFDKSFLLLFSIVGNFNRKNIISIYLFGINFSSFLKSILDFSFILHQLYQ
ncbi:MAG TPA: hypothetical protein VN854_00225 [Mycoplasmatales bacterium]|nr:hypothetical protein [Mycoplasmatales bacterium]